MGRIICLLVTLACLNCLQNAEGQSTNDAEYWDFSLADDLTAFLANTAPGLDPTQADINGSDARESTWRRSTPFAGNGIPDAAEFALLQHVLDTPSVELARQGGISHTVARKVFVENLALATEHLPKLDAAFKRIVAAYSMINFNRELNFVAILAREPWPGYKIKGQVQSLGASLHYLNSADGDDRTNLGEWQSSGGNVDKFVRLALDGESRSTLWDELDTAPLYEQPESKRRIVRVVLGVKVLNPELEALASDCKVAMFVDGTRVPEDEEGWPVAVGSPIQLAAYTNSTPPLAFKCWMLAHISYPETFSCVNSFLYAQDILEEEMPLYAAFYWDVLRDPEFDTAFECTGTPSGERITVRATLPPKVWRALSIMGFQFVERAPEPGALVTSEDSPWVLSRTFRGIKGGDGENLLPMPEHLWSIDHE